MVLLGKCAELLHLKEYGTTTAFRRWYHGILDMYHGSTMYIVIPWYYHLILCCYHFLQVIIFTYHSIYEVL